VKTNSISYTNITNYLYMVDYQCPSLSVGERYMHQFEIKNSTVYEETVINNTARIDLFDDSF
jgi:hypothetical protein